MQVQTIFCNQIQYCVFRTSVRARILKFLSKPSPTPIYYPQVFASALSRNSPGTAIAIPRDSRAHPLARWFAGRSPTGNRPATHSRQSPVSDWLVPGPTLSCNSSGKAIAILRACRAHRLARWFAGRSPTCHTRPCRACIPLSCNSSCTPIAFLRASRAHPLARWHQFVSIERPNPLQTALQGISARAMVCRRKNSFAKPSEPNTRSTAEKSGATSD